MDKNYLKNEQYTLNIVKQAEIKAMEFYQGIFKPRLLARDNYKLPKNVLCLDLPCKVTCKYNCPNCYAYKTERFHNNTVPEARAYRYEIIKQALKNKKHYDFLIEYLCVELDKHMQYCNKKNLLPIFRIHASGDIFSNKYLELLLHIVKLYPNINFYTYTKQLNNDTIDKLNQLPNLNIVKSIIKINGKNKINYGCMEYINDLQNKLLDNNTDSYICQYGISKENSTCMVDCNKCLHCSHVLFKQH